MKNYSYLVIMMLCACAKALDEDIETVKELDLNKYKGRWYEAYNSWLAIHTFEKDGFCMCADYGIRPDGKISVFNARRVHSATGKASGIHGYAEIIDPKYPGRLRVVFPYAPNGSYLVIKLGPLNKDGLYSYTVVTSTKKKLLWILVRDHDDYMKNHDAEVQKYVKEQGFTTFLNKPVKSYQGKDCLYPPTM